MTLGRSFDQATNVEHRLSGFVRDFAIAILLVLVTLLPLGVRASLVVMVSIPLSLAIGVTLLRFTGFSINQLSIVGFVIALGLLVDDSVVVVENVARHVREGRSPRDAAVAATREITLSVLGCTATLVFAFLPLLALPGGAGALHPLHAGGRGLHHPRLARGVAHRRAVPLEPRSSGPRARTATSSSAR